MDLRRSGNNYPAAFDCGDATMNVAPVAQAVFVNLNKLIP